MESLVYSLNATVPVFLVMIIGYVLKRVGMLNDEFVKAADKLNYKITLPALLFGDMLAMDFRELFDGAYVLFCAGATTICYFVIWAGAHIFLKNKRLTAEFVQASFRGSAAVLGASFVLNMYGNTGMIPLMIVGSVPLFNVYSVIVLTVERERESKNMAETLVRALVDILKNPIILGIVSGMILSLLHVDFPKIIDTTVENIANIATPLALLCIGASFEGRKALAMVKETMAVSVIKLVIQPAIFLPIAVMLGFTGQKLIALIIMLAAPTTPSCYIMAKNMGHDGVLTSGAVVATTMLSSFTITFCIFVVRYLGLV